jgi:predicted amidohydrolase YtcJ
MMPIMNPRLLFLFPITVCALTNLVYAQKGPKKPVSADAIYSGGNILTMVGDEPHYAEALAVKNGRILMVGTKSDAQRSQGPATKVIDLGGKTLLPGFIDAHGHIVDYTLRGNSPDLSPPPVSDVSSIEQLVAKMKPYVAANPPAAGKIAFGLGYDDSLLAERRHPTRADLDRISQEIPILVTHVSGHIVAVNSKAMELAKITKSTPDPMGGLIQKDTQTGEPNGVFEEQAGQIFVPLLAVPSTDARVQSLDELMRWYASFGITTAEDAISSPQNIAILLQKRKQADRPLIDIVSYPMWAIFNDVLSGKKKLDIDYTPPNFDGCAHWDASDLPKTRGGADIDRSTREKVGVYVNGIKFAGIKITGDGAPVGKTAYLTKPYLNPPHGQPADYRGYPTLPQEDLDKWFDAAYQNHIQIVMHCNGDAAADMMIAAVRKAVTQYGKKDLRPVMIHSQFIRHDQVETMKELGIIPSFFTSHTFYWGDWHLNETGGRERAFGMSPMNYAHSLGMKFTNAADSPIVPPSILDLVWTAVNRVSRSGVVVGPDERVSPYVALKSVTDYAAFQHFEERSKGTLEAGKMADLVMLEKNPLTVDPMTIKDIKVIETIKGGKSIYKATSR